MQGAGQPYLRWDMHVRRLRRAWVMFPLGKAQTCPRDHGDRQRVVFIYPRQSRGFVYEPPKAVYSLLEQFELI